VYYAKTNFNDRQVTVVYDKQRVSLEQIKQVLTEEHFPPQGEAVFLK
jgi:copper chaperone CopZ